MDIGLSYDDVCLIPRYNKVKSRRDPVVSTLLTKNTRISIPIVAANMDTIIGYKLAKVLNRNGSTPLFHRFYPDNEKGDRELVDLVRTFSNNCFMSVGVGNNSKKVMKLVDKWGLQPLGFCVDIAHGHSKMVEETIKALKNWQPGLDIIAGNVCTEEAVKDLVDCGADAIKVGIGPGSVCVTRKVTAFGRAQFSAVKECAKMGMYYQVPIIADGGIKSSREVILALAAGASSVMIGGLFAKSYEAEGGGRFRGQASAEFQKAFYGKIKNGVPEGISKQVELEYPAQALIDNLIGGLRSGMTYAGANNINELRQNAIFERITPNYF